jgi:hypothetical protein
LLLLEGLMKQLGFLRMWPLLLQSAHTFLLLQSASASINERGNSASHFASPLANICLQ